MPFRIRDFLFCLVLLLVVSGTGCTCVDGELPELDGGGGSGGNGGAGGEDLGPCGMDCATLDTPPCTMGVCNTGQALGPVNSCVVVASPKGTSCDDGVFCTSEDACDSGVCVGGTTNDCGLAPGPCDALICTESSQTCSVTPVNDGTSCVPTDLCEINGVCQVGECLGEPRDCSLSALNECNTVDCDPETGQCIGTPDPFKDNSPCFLSGDPCQVDKACQAGQCVGGNPRDCSAFDVACEIGVCDPGSGICGPINAPEGTSCEEGITECHVGSCDANGQCKAESALDGTACNDHDACSAADECELGACAGGPAVTGCSLHYSTGFEACPNGWTMGGDWECGAPQGVGPPAAHNGNNVMATKIGGVYSVSQSFATTVADSPPINLTTATNPMLSFWAWDHTEGSTFDGWNLKISINGGQSFTQVTTVTPAYPLTISGQQAWGGNHALEGWKNYQADLTAYAGQTVILRFAFRSDGATVYPGVYIDDVFVAEPLQNPLYILTSSLPDVYAGADYSVALTRAGGTAAAQWSIVPGGVNDDWLSIDPLTGVLTGSPTVNDTGPVTVTVRLEQPTLPTNFDEQTYELEVQFASYYTSFEDPCPADWTLTGDWQCGVPSAVGPPAAYLGTQVIATQIAGNYTVNETYAATNATSPAIDLSGSPLPTVTWRMWIDTEGSTHDGVNLKISIDGGVNWEVVDTVIPGYPLTIATEPAWGGHQQGLGWQLMQANLAAYTGQTVRLRFSFRSDSSDNSPGIYVDDFLVQ